MNQGNYDKLTSNHTEGGILEEGFAKDESKEGTWLKYDKEGNLIGITSYMDGKINIDDLITHKMPLEDINKAFDLMHAGKSIRSVVEF